MPSGLPSTSAGTQQKLPQIPTPSIQSNRTKHSEAVTEIVDNRTHGQYSSVETREPPSGEPVRGGQQKSSGEGFAPVGFLPNDIRSSSPWNHREEDQPMPVVRHPRRGSPTSIQADTLPVVANKEFRTAIGAEEEFDFSVPSVAPTSTERELSFWERLTCYAED